MEEGQIRRAIKELYGETALKAVDSTLDRYKERRQIYNEFVELRAVCKYEDAIHHLAEKHHYSQRTIKRYIQYFND